MNKNLKSTLAIFVALSGIATFGYSSFAGSTDPNDLIKIQNVIYGQDFGGKLKGETFDGTANFKITFSGVKADNAPKTCEENVELNVINGLTTYDKSNSSCVFDEFKQLSLVTVDIKGDLDNDTNYSSSTDYAYSYQYQFASYNTKTYFDNRNIQKNGFIDNGSMGNTGKILDSRLPF